MARAKKPEFVDLLMSIWTLIPVVAGISVAMIVWAAQTKGGMKMPAFLLITGFLVGLGSMMTQWILIPDSVDPQRVKLRQEVLDDLDTLRRAKPRRGCLEAEQGATAAQTERV